MRAQTVDIRESVGRILCCTIFRPGGRKLLAKGHVISEEDIRLLEIEGMGQVWVTMLEDGEVPEDDAVLRVASEMGCGCVEIRLAVGGRANLFATEDCCVLVDDELLRQINCTASIVIATALNFTYAKAGTRIATVKSAPFAVAGAQLDAVTSILKDRGPILQARPIRHPAVGVLYSDPVAGERARQMYEPIVKQRLEKFGVSNSSVMNSVEDEAHVAKSLQFLLRSKPTAILIASTTTPAGPEDVIGRAMTRVECHIEKYLAPVEPGNLLMLGYREETPIVSAPGCFRSIRQNVVDLVLPPMLSRYRLSGWELATLGHGGLLG
jgi:molybdenum cofactor cytidylyltransferase